MRVMDTIQHDSGAGEDLGAIGLGILCKLTGAETGGAYSMFEYVVPPGGGGPPTHVHSRQDEVFTCTRGTVRVLLDGVEHLLEPGDMLRMPRGVPHMFDNPHDVECRVVAVVSPPGLEDYYRDLAALPPGPRDMGLLAEVMARHGLRLAPRPDDAS